MKTNFVCRLRRGALTALLAALGIAAPARAAVITYAGAQTNLGSGWRSPGVSKPLDIDGDNVLGTDGYDLVNLPASTPSYVSAMAILTTTYPGNGTYAQIDDPTNLPALFTTGTMNPFPGAGANADVFQFTLNATAVGRTIRVGLLVNNLDLTAYNAASLTLVQTNGAGATNGPIDTTPAVFNDRNPDWVFFDITTAAAGDTFIIRGAGGSAGAATVGGVVFDSANPFEVATTNDAGELSLRGRVAAAPSGSTITFARNLSGTTITLTNGEILLAHYLVIDASALPGGITINGNGQSRIFDITSEPGDVLTALTLTNGVAPANGGAIITTSYHLMINRCTIAGCSVGFGYSGGAIYNVGTAFLNECTLTGNFTGELGTGGAIFNVAGGGLVVDQCTLVGNSADDGGGIDNQGTIISMINSIVAGNHATYGPDIDNSGSLLRTGTNLVQSVWQTFGTSSGPAAISASPLLFPLGNYGGPTPTMPPLPGSPAIDAGDDSTTSQNPATDQRGRPRFSGAHVDIGAVESQIQVVTNHADTGSGSLRDALAAAGLANIITFAPDLSGRTIQLSNGVLMISRSVGIDASALPGGLTLDGRNASRIFDVETGGAVLNGLTLAHGQAGAGSGGAIYNADTLTLNACTLTGNSAANGGAVDNLGSLTLNACTLAGNAVNGGGGFAAPGGGILNFGALTLNESTLANNVAANGGAIYNGNSLALNQCTLTANLANGGSGGGGAVYNAGTLTVSNSIVAGNNQPIGADIYGPVTYSGVNWTAGDPQLAPLGNYGGPTPTMPPWPGSPVIDAGTNGSSFLADQRGFPRVIGSFADIGAVEFSSGSSIVANNLDGGLGSLRYAMTHATNGSLITFDPGLSAASIVLTNGEISIGVDQTVDASALPGGITINGNQASRAFEVVSNVTAVFNALTITNGLANPPGGGARNQRIGGAILNAGNLTINQCTLAGSLAIVGGGLANDGNLTMNHCVLSGNTGTSEGGGIANSGTGIMVVNDSTVSTCSALAGSGGGIDNYGSLAVNRCTLSGNSANLGGGGGISNEGSDSLAINNSTLMANVASVGGGIYNHGLVTLSQCTLAGNVAPERGGGIFNFGSRVGGAAALAVLNQCTLTANTSYGSGNVGNSGVGGGIWNSSTLTMTNSIVAGNHALTASDIYGDAIYGGANLTNGNPLLAPLANYGGPTQTTPPLAGSPAIDGCTNGIDPSLATDQRGFPRVAGNYPDLGAVEGVYNPAGPGILTGMSWMPNGTASFSFTNFTDMSFTALAATNVAWPLNLWSNLGPAVESPAGSGHYQFTDPQAANSPQRFYRVRSP